MLLNLEKCSVMHVGKRNQELSHEMEGKVLKVSEEERDLEVIMISTPLKQDMENGESKEEPHKRSAIPSDNQLESHV